MNVQKLIKNGKPTLAAMLLFGNHGYSIHIGRFKAADTIIDDLLIKSPLIVGLDETIVLECGGDMPGQVPDKFRTSAGQVKYPGILSHGAVCKRNDDLL